MANSHARPGGIRQRLLLEIVRVCPSPVLAKRSSGGCEINFALINLLPNYDSETINDIKQSSKRIRGGLAVWNMIPLIKINRKWAGLAICSRLDFPARQNMELPAWQLARVSLVPIKLPSEHVNKVNTLNCLFISRHRLCANISWDP